MGCQQCLPLSVVQLKGKHCRKLQCRDGVVDTFGQNLKALHPAPPALGSDGPGVGGWAMVSGNPQVEGFIGIASPILLQSPVSLP